MPDNDYNRILDDFRRDAANIPAGVEGDTVFENACSLGVQAEEETDARRWFIGGLADALKGRYGEDRIGQFASKIKAKRRRVYDYAQSYAFYPDFARRALSEACPNLTYSHFRTAMRLGLWLEKHERLIAYDEAISFLDLCAASDWGADEADIEAKKRKGEVITTTVFDDEARLAEVYVSDHQSLLLVFDVPADAGMEFFRERAGQLFGLKLTEETKAKEVEHHGATQ